MHLVHSVLPGQPSSPLDHCSLNTRFKTIVHLAGGESVISQFLPPFGEDKITIGRQGNNCKCPATHWASQGNRPSRVVCKFRLWVCCKTEAVDGLSTPHEKKPPTEEDYHSAESKSETTRPSSKILTGKLVAVSRYERNGDDLLSH